MDSLKPKSQGSVPPILDVVELNSHGILRLQENRRREAIDLFSVGLRSVIASIQSINEQQSGISTDFDFTFPTGMEMLNSVKISVGEVSCADGSDDDSDCRFTIYNRALRISLDSVDTTSMIPESYYQLLCGVFLYNIGLTNHLIAMETGSSSTLSRALDFYSVAHRTIPEDPPPSPEQRCEQGLNLAYLAIANNVGHIHCVRSNHPETRICADEIFDRLTFLLAASPASKHEMAAIEEQEKKYRVFMLNASFFLMTENLPASAA